MTGPNVDQYLFLSEIRTFSSYSVIKKKLLVISRLYLVLTFSSFLFAVPVQVKFSATGSSLRSLKELTRERLVTF